MTYGISIISVIPMRHDPQEQSEMVSQLLFGECYTVLNEKEKWLNIRTQYDDYQGWIDKKLHHEIPESYFLDLSWHNPPVLSSRFAEIRCPDASSLVITAGSSLPAFKKAKNTICIEDKVFGICMSSEDLIDRNRKNIAARALRFVNSPYLWGGRSFFGYDCSGFVQVIFKIYGIPLLRDASQQAIQGDPVKSVTEINPGDLAFFAGEEGGITHVGLMVSPQEIIHCSGFVRVDSLDEKGIYHAGLQKYTHRLSHIRRML
jgi:hypothetical protein